MAIRFASEDEAGKSRDVDVSEDGSYLCPSCGVLARPEEGGCQNPDCEVGRLNREVTRQVEKLGRAELKDAERELEAGELEYDGKVFSGGARVTSDGRLEWVGPSMSRIGTMIWYAHMCGPEEEPMIRLGEKDLELGVRLPDLDDEGGEARTCPDLRSGWFRIVQASMLAYGETDNGTPEVLSSVVVHAELERLGDEWQDARG